jgi:hypothetical protein
MLAMTWSFPPQRAQSSISMPNTRFSRRAQLAVRGEHAVVARQVHPRRWNQCRQPRHEIQRLDHDMRGAVAVRGLEWVAHVPG